MTTIRRDGSTDGITPEDCQARIEIEEAIRTAKTRGWGSTQLGRRLAGLILTVLDSRLEGYEKEMYLRDLANAVLE